MADYAYEIKIPKERVAVLIGKNGETKKLIEEETSVQLDIDSNEGDVFIKGDDALGLYSAREVVLAIGRGFNPSLAKLLIHGDNIYETVSLADYGKDKEKLIRLKGRIIGSAGKTRRLIEELTLCHLSVYGKTVGILGESENVQIAKQAISQLILGSTHAKVYSWLETKRRQLRKNQILRPFDKK